MREPGKVCDGLWCLGRLESNVYYLDGGQEAMLISGGLTYLAPLLLEQMACFGLAEEKISKLLILHSHFDHVGVVPFFKRRLPGMQVFASPRAWQILAKPQAVATVNQFSRAAAQMYGPPDLYQRYDLDWPAELGGQAVSDGEVISVGPYQVQIIEVPGHSSCSIAAYVPALKALLPSDAGGIPHAETIVAAGNSNFTQYQQSLHKLKPLAVDYLCADHFGYVAGEEAGGYLERSIEAAAQERARLEVILREVGEPEDAARQMTEQFFAENPDYFLPRQIFEGVARQKMRHLASCLAQQD
jgi:glyoxylase-like metal-dependent hydrolase (beta-lactamase superfamily II)